MDLGNKAKCIGKYQNGSDRKQSWSGGRASS